MRVSVRLLPAAMSEFGRNALSTQSIINGEGEESGHAIITLEDQADLDDTPLTIPVGHLTTTGSLFSLTPLRPLLGEYPEDFMMQIERRRVLKFGGRRTQSFEEELSFLDLSRESNQALIDAFFFYIYPNFPVLTPDIFRSIYEKVMEHDFRRDAESALCLAVLALGKFATNLSSTGNTESQDDLNGMEYFSLAYEIAVVEWGASLGADVILPSTLVHGAIYLFHMARPLQAWKLVTLASSNLQLIKARSVISASHFS
ncbi:unnamed protein product [Clonostachys byssicola]|uniref:Transcription factor domain-containing protein n=1 Tax=Clonostachys byssicola TaxID=160290 RepID=A0A9N9UUQ5_9HYPO|nr:unnamed protein product [Clonostachys byssicola]